MRLIEELVERDIKTFQSEGGEFHGQNSGSLKSIAATHIERYKCEQLHVSERISVPLLILTHSAAHEKQRRTSFLRNSLVPCFHDLCPTN